MRFKTVKIAYQRKVFFFAFLELLLDVNRFVGRICVNTPNGNSPTFDVDLLTCTVDEIMAKIEGIEGTPANMHQLMFDGRRLDRWQTLSQCNVDYESRLDLVKKIPRMAALRKPVIYLFAPVSVDASVKLSVVPQWSLSAVYPVTSIKSGTAGANQCVSWKVRVHPEGHLTELSTGLDIAYLYWEAL